MSRWHSVVPIHWQLTGYLWQLTERPRKEHFFVCAKLPKHYSMWAKNYHGNILVDSKIRVQLYKDIWALCPRMISLCLPSAAIVLCGIRSNCTCHWGHPINSSIFGAASLQTLSHSQTTKQMTCSLAIKNRRSEMKAWTKISGVLQTKLGIVDNKMLTKTLWCWGVTKKKCVKKNTNEQGNDIGKKDDPQNGACATSGNPCRQN